MRALLALLVLLPALAPASAAAGAPPLTEADAPLDAASALWALGSGSVDLVDVVLAQLAHQEGQAEEMTAAARLPRPPALAYRDATPFCDVDGDGARDLLVNELTLAAAPGRSGARSELEAISGATGERLWKVDNLFHASAPAIPGASYTGRGEPFPLPPGSPPAFDLDDDGACDVVALGAEALPGSLSTPFLNDPSVSRTLFVVRAISGATGEDLWRQEIVSTRIDVGSSTFGIHRTIVIRDVPTGLLAYDAPEGPRLVLKTTDVRYSTYDMPFTVRVGILPGRPAVLQGAPHAEDVRVTEHVQMRDAASGGLLWQRDLGAESATDLDARFTNLTWLAGVAPLGGGGELDVVLDQFVITTPRANEMTDPVTGEPLFRYGRGARVTTLDGGDGATLWESLVLDPLAAQANVQQEESMEVLAWTRSALLPDIDGDGLGEVLATYVTEEMSLAGTTNGAYRTHFAPLSGANGTKLWDVRQQGWGVARALDEGPTRTLGLGMLDVPTAPGAGARFPPKFVRVLALEAATGEPRWTYERSFAQNSLLSYNLGLAQYVETLAPHDWDGDGVRDMVTPAQEAPRTARDQVLMATSSHTYSVLSGADGREIGAARAWGPDGRVVACDGSPDTLTVLSGHARRLQLARFAVSGDPLWTTTLHNDPAPRAAGAGMDTLALGAACADDGGATLAAVNLQAYSFARLHEVVPVLARLDAAGQPRWMTPELGGTPPGDALFQASLRDDTPGTGALVATAVAAAALGGLGAVATIVLLARAGSRILVVGLVLLLVAPSALALTLPGSPLASAVQPAAPSPTTEAPVLAEPLDRAPLTPEDMVEAARTFVKGRSFDNESLSRFADNDTISFPHLVGDVDGDGADDLALDQYCMSGPACWPRYYIPEGMVALLADYQCGPGHDLVLVSGGNGSILWAKELAIRGPFGSCGEHFVVGTMPVGDRTALLVYRYQVIWPAWIGANGVILHDLLAISAEDGSTLWTYSAKGAFESDFLTHFTARDFVINPILQVAGPANERLLPDTTGAALFLQGVGWTTTGASTIFPIIPGYPLTNDPLTLWDVHQPHEWAASLDLDTGAELWKRDTFGPTPGRNALPMAVDGRYGSQLFAPESVKRGIYWEEAPCCFDVTGDGTPDLVFRVIEWNPLPNAKVQPPARLDARLVMLDGATGATHVDRYVAEDVDATPSTSYRDRYQFILGLFLTQFGFDLDYELVGDADGDGAADLLEHQVHLAPEFRQTLTLVSGRTGEPLWSTETVRDMRTLVLGDADGDGGNDFLLLDWYGHEGRPERPDDFVTPDVIPLTMHSGATGERIWRASTYLAPIDVLEAFKTIRRNGIIDVDGDGVGEFFADDPIYLDDQTTVHQVQVLSGRDGGVLRTMRAVGGFALPAGAGDLDGDGRGEVALLQGDVSDMWLTLHDGATGDAEWSRRIIAFPSSGYAQALPYLRLDPMQRGDGRVLAVTFHLDVLRQYSFYGLSFSDEGFESGEITGTYEMTMPQVLQLGAEQGRLDWALPAVADVDRFAHTLGPTPGVSAFETIAERASAVGLLGATAREARPYALPATAGFAAAYALTLVAGIAVVRFRTRFTGVPELE